MRAVLPAAWLLLASLTTPAVASAAPLLLTVDADDDDGDRVADRNERVDAGDEDLVALPVAKAARRFERVEGVGELRVLVDGAPVALGGAVPASSRALLQATSPGAARVVLSDGVLEVRVLELRAQDAAGRTVDLATSHASVTRTPPARDLAPDDPDALRFLLVGDAADLPPLVHVTSLDPAGAPLDVLRDVPLEATTCPPDVVASLACAATPLLRAVPDDIDRNHPIARGRSVRAELGGALVVSSEGRKLQMLRVGGPRTSPAGAIERFRGHLRVRMVRIEPGGKAPVGGSDAEALEAARTQVLQANQLWASCGVSFGDARQVDALVVDPPPPYLLALGCDLGLPATGGTLRFACDDHPVSVALPRGATPAAAARLTARALERAGFAATVADNPRIAAGALGSSDVLVRRHDGSLATLSRPTDGPLLDDATLGACLGVVDLTDGLQHFTDVDAVVGSLEERTLLHAFDDGDPATIEVVIVPAFATGGRIGESFIYADAGAIRSTVLEDRASLEADRASFALAHELGHLLLDEPGHPDDFGADTSTLLMDADAADPSAFGPRRLTLEECARTLRQSGPASPHQLLAPWPLGRLGAAR